MADVSLNESDEVTIADSAGTNKLTVTIGGAALVDGSATTQPVSATSLPLPAGAATAANQATTNASLAAIDAGIPAALGQTTMAASMPVTIASNQTPLQLQQSGGTATITRVATSTTAATLLAANANRRTAIVATESGINYLAFGSTASTTNYTYPVGSGVVVVVTNYTGSLSLIRSAGSGSVQVTEITA
jgi:hypothetical protein